LPPELDNLIGRKVTHAGVYTEAGIKASLAISSFPSIPDRDFSSAAYHSCTRKLRQTNMALIEATWPIGPLH
jgi:hypothetical protein